MNENIQKMLELLSQDEETQKKLSAIHDPEEAYELVTSIHGGYTKEEFIETMTMINAQLNQDIDEEDLAKTSGGTDKTVLKASAYVASSAFSGGVITGVLAGGSIAAASAVASGAASAAAV